MFLPLWILSSSGPCVDFMKGHLEKPEVLRVLLLCVCCFFLCIDQTLSTLWRRFLFPLSLCSSNCRGDMPKFCPLLRESISVWTVSLSLPTLHPSILVVFTKVLSCSWPAVVMELFVFGRNVDTFHVCCSVPLMCCNSYALLTNFETSSKMVSGSKIEPSYTIWSVLFLNTLLMDWSGLILSVLSIESVQHCGLWVRSQGINAGGDQSLLSVSQVEEGVILLASFLNILSFGISQKWNMFVQVLSYQAVVLSALAENIYTYFGFGDPSPSIQMGSSVLQFSSFCA